MPNTYVEYLNRPVRQGATDRQRAKLLDAAKRALDRNPLNSRAMLCYRLNQRRVTSEEAYAQVLRVAAQSAQMPQCNCDECQIYGEHDTPMSDPQEI